MATVSERSRELAKQLFTHSCVQAAPICTCEYELIEHALLAERRLAMEEAAKIAEQTANAEQIGTGRRYTLLLETPDTMKAKIASELRAAAEKEVGK